MNLRLAISTAAHDLRHLETPNLEAEVLLSALLKQNRTWLKTHPEFELSPEQQSQFSDWINQRANHTPTAYIIGQVTWSGLDIKVSPDTLIPRDETEMLCHHIKQEHPKAPKSILDVGTGSGCIAIWCQTAFPHATVTALDLSETALAVARKNATALELQIDFKHSDLLQAVPNQSHYDLMVANLPYVPESINVTAEVKAEPHSAIFSKDDGLFHIKQLATDIKQKKITFNQLWLEFLPSQASSISAIFADYTVEPFTAVNGEIFFAQIKPRV